jgi:predicted DNA-binding transcriptional regulator YafY
MKIDRLIAITLYLLNRGVVSVSELAARFEVSKRTIQRDVDTLNQAGIPITALHGSEGGYEILDGFKLQKQIAGVEDYQNVITGLKGFLTAYESRRVSATLEKMRSVAPQSAQHVFIDLSVAREGQNVDAHMRTIETAIDRATPLQIEYVSADLKSSRRVVEPLALAYQWYAWYLLAFCTLKQDYRLFKLSRISACEPTPGRTFSREHGDVEALLNQQLRADTRRRLEIRLRCKPEVRQAVLEYLTGKILEEEANGDFIYGMCVPENERMWFSLLLGFGDRVQVLEPEELKARLRHTAEELLSIYPSQAE